jgi:excisionase family DNA binding protein
MLAENITVNPRTTPRAEGSRMPTKPTSEPPPRLAYTLNEAAEAIGVSERQVRRYIADGTLTAKRPGGRVIIPVEALKAFLKSAPAA